LKKILETFFEKRISKKILKRKFRKKFEKYNFVFEKQVQSIPTHLIKTKFTSTHFTLLPSPIYHQNKQALSVANKHGSLPSPLFFGSFRFVGLGGGRKRGWESKTPKTSFLRPRTFPSLPSPKWAHGTGATY